jgi:anhydro-N-acetylmuramic acid kinase
MKLAVSGTMIYPHLNNMFAQAAGNQNWNYCKYFGLEYQLPHIGFWHYMGELLNDFISKNGLDLRVHLIAVQGHSFFHLAGQALTVQLGSGASITAETQLPVVSDLRSMDLTFGGQGLPLAAIGQKLLPPLENKLPIP